MKTHMNWDRVEKGHNIRVGNIEVDSATVGLGDEVQKQQLIVFTPEGDGGYPVFAKKIDGRRCLVIDFDLVDYGTGKIFYDNEEDLLPEGEENFKDGIRGEAYRLCPKCSKKIVRQEGSPGYRIIECENGHRTEYIAKEFMDFEDR